MATNTNNIEDAVRRRAYELWEQYGRPESGEKEFWLKAEREIKQAKGLNGTAPMAAIDEAAEASRQPGRVEGLPRAA